MFEIFIALFGGLYYLLRIAGDKSNTKVAQKEEEDRAKENRAWDTRVMDNDLERRLLADMCDQSKWPELTQRLLAYKIRYPDFCRHIKYVKGDRGWDFVKEGMELTEWYYPSTTAKRAVCGPKRWCLELLMFTYGKCTWNLAFNTRYDARYESAESYGYKNSALAKRPERLTLDAMKYIFTHQIPSL